MSTRATYRIKGTEYHQSATFYIHYDGYEAGAAHYIASMLALDNTRGGWPCMFLRANETAELTESHAAHGDTEFRYDLDEKGQTVTVYARTGAIDFDNPQFKVLGKFDVLEFIAKHAEWEQTPREFATLNGRYVAKARALAWINERLTYAQAAYFQGWIGNASGSLADVKRHEILLTPNERNIVAAIDKALTERFAETRS